MFDADTCDELQAEYMVLRNRRRFGEAACLAGVWATAVAMAVLGARSATAVYLLLAATSAWTAAASWLVREFSRQPHASTAGDLAKGAPTALLAAYVLAWLCCDVLLLGTAALPRPFGPAVTGSLTIALYVMAVFMTWHQPPPQQTSMFPLAAVCWAALALPCAGATVSAAPAWTTAVRLAVLFAVHAGLALRSAARLTPDKLAELSEHQASVQLVGAAAHAAAMHVVQTAWLLHCPSPSGLALAIPLLCLAEARVHARRHHRAQL